MTEQFTEREAPNMADQPTRDTVPGGWAADESDDGTTTPRSAGDVLRTVGRALGPNKVSALYVLVAEIIVFCIWAPNTFPQVATIKQVLNSNAVIGLAALALAVPLAARVYDLSFAYTMTLAGVTAAHFVAVNHWPLALAIAFALVLALLIGVINAVVVVVFKVNSMIGTLGTGSIIQAIVSMVTSDQDVTGPRLFGSFSKIGQSAIGGVTLPVLYLVIIALVIWFVLGRTPLGRRIYATGYNADAARLSGIKTKRIQFGSLLVSALLAGVAGVVLASILGAGSYTGGTPYLLPAFAAAFLGETQITPGRVNAWGTILGVLALGTGITGLSLADAPSWASDLFTGVVLIASLAAAQFQRRTGAGISRSRHG